MNSLLDTTRSTTSCLRSDAEPAIVSQQERIANIERLRFLAACGVVSFHTHDWFPRGFGVVGFLVLLLSFCVFVVNKPEPYGFADLAKRKAVRLLKPWLFWSVVYGGVGLAKVIYMGVPFSEVFSPTMFLTGTRIHLWFLPFGFVAALLLVLVHQRMVKLPEIFGIVAAASVGLVCVLGCSIVWCRVQLPVPLEQWALGLPAIPLGFAIGRATVLPERKDRRNLHLFIVLATAAAFVAYTALLWLERGTWFNHGSKFVIRYCISVAVVCCALHWQGKLDWITKTLASSSYGVYLIHPLIVIFLSRVGSLDQHPVVLLCLVLVASILITLALQRTRLKQFV